ncbi:hypothetical protein DPMN_170796 [Dreissena polymorpha]|uniref:Uncharacterized protein n=1 Tax=Dreissena polymorpha TaxID=45954 RepID=A0A9D4DZ36_DREPO|nr:hypothetical protein DPMN_170796 [Dreissena polymorpha]
MCRLFTPHQLVTCSMKGATTKTGSPRPSLPAAERNAIIVKSRKTAPPTGGHLFQRARTTFELNQFFELNRNIIGTNLLTKFHEDRTINVASIVFTNKCGQTDDGQRPVTKAHLSNQVS